jgi:nitrile hydratase
MNGAQDMGGVDGFGPVIPEPETPVFHHEWQRRVLALTLAMARPGGWNIDMSRHARENRPPLDYLSKSYYQIWLAGLTQLLAERGLVSAEELAAGHSLSPALADRPILTADLVDQVLRQGGPTLRTNEGYPLFSLGQNVRARHLHPTGHTRLPRYVRGHVGVIETIHGCHVFPDSNAHGHGEAPQWLYTVRFSASELWGERGDPTSSVSVEAWQSYLEPCDDR